MGTIEQIFSFLSTLYTPRRALITVFMVIGITICLIFLGPIFNHWLTPVFKPVTENYLAYIAFLTAVLGVGLSVVVFSFCEKLCKWANQIRLVQLSKRKARADKEEKESTRQQAEAKFVQHFLTAYPHLDENLIGILEYLAIEGDTPFLSTAETVKFLNKQGWIYAVVQVRKYEHVYKINSLIKNHVAVHFWNEIETNIKNALSSPEPAIKVILQTFESDNNDHSCQIDYLDFYSVSIQEILNSCFQLNGRNSQLRVTFKNHYKNAFESSMSKSLKERIEIVVSNQHGSTHSQVF